MMTQAQYDELVEQEFFATRFADRLPEDAFEALEEGNTQPLFTAIGNAGFAHDMFADYGIDDLYNPAQRGVLVQYIADNGF